jgi:hypothetical protein
MRCDRVGWQRLAMGLVAAVFSVGASERLANATRPIFIWFADGGLPPPSAKKICAGRPPAFQCPLGATVEACRAPILALLDRWYAAFDVVFTYAPPTTDAGGADAGGAAFDTVIVSSEGAWCGADPRTVSLSPLPPCADPGGGGTVAIFRCQDAKACATLIAKEQGHLVGLQHTGSATDVMNERGDLDHDGFEDRENLSAAPKCGLRQNSYQLMLQRLGAWPGGPKPGPGEPPPPNFPGTVDAAIPAPVDDAAVPGDPPGPDATAPTSDAAAMGPGASDATGATTSADAGGCSCQQGGATPRRASSGKPLWLGLGAVLAVRVGWRRRRVFVSSLWRGNPGPNPA